MTSLFDARRRLREWIDAGPTVSSRAHAPTYERPSELKADVRQLLDATYDMTPVDALLSDIAVDAMLDALEPDHVMDRVKQFGIEVGTLDEDGKPHV